MNHWLWFLIFWTGIMPGPGPASAQSPAEDTPPVLVGHITHVEGQLLRYVPEEADWLAAVQDAPFGLDDALYATRNSRAEIRLPNRGLIRLNERTQIQLIALEEDYSELDLYSGMARFHHYGPGTMKVYTPFGSLVAPAGAVFDLRSGEKVTEVLVLQGELEFRPAGSEARYPVVAGRPALLADGRQVLTGGQGVDPQWQAWNASRDQAAARYRDYPGESARYLPPELDYQAPVLDENGRWEQVPYQGETYYFWRPLQVIHGWAPFTVGRWTVWYDDPCWIPAEPFGYVTHHYGNWFFIRGFWYWAPPVRPRVRPHPVPLFPIAWAWYPGRVAWIHHGATVGWIPLAPHEPYYCRRHWGPRAVVVKDPRVAPVPVSRYQHAHLAVAVHRDNFFAVTNYQPFRLPPLKRDAVSTDFQSLPVLDRTFLTGADPLRRKHHYTTAMVRERPRPAAVDRIRLNQARFQETERVRRAVEAPPAGKAVPPRVVSGSGPGTAAPPTAGPEKTPARQKDLPDRFRTPPPAAPARPEGPANEIRPRTGPGTRPDTRPGPPPCTGKGKGTREGSVRGLQTGPCPGPVTGRPAPPGTRLPAAGGSGGGERTCRPAGSTPKTGPRGWPPRPGRTLGEPCRRPFDHGTPGSGTVRSSGTDRGDGFRNQAFQGGFASRKREVGGGGPGAQGTLAGPRSGG